MDTFTFAPNARIGSIINPIRVTIQEVTCAEGFYIRSKPNSLTGECAPHTVCMHSNNSSMQYEAVAPTLTTDRICKDVKVCRPEYEFEIAVPTASTDRVCAAR